MKLTVATQDLANALKRVCVKKGADGILGHVLLEADRESGLTVSGTDLVREVKLCVAANVSVGGSRTAHAGLLTGFAGYAPAEVTQIALHEGKLLVKSGRTRASIPHIAPEAYYSAISTQAQGVTFRLRPDFLADWNNIAFCTNGDHKAFLGGVYVYPSGQKWVSVASTGVSLMETKLDAPENGAALPPIIIPSDSVRLAAALFPDGCDFFVGSSMVRFSDEAAMMATLLLEGPWFDAYVRQIEPGSHTVKMDRKRLLKGISFVKRTQDKITISCVDNLVKLVSGRDDGARAQDEFECEGALPFEVIVMAEYFEPVIGALNGSSLTIRLRDQAAPIIMSGERDEEIGVVWPRKF